MKKYGQLSSKDIEKEKAVQTGLKIVPFSDNCLKGASYDISPTIIAMSTKVGMLETVYCDKSDPDKYYIYVKAKDTVLAISKEYIVLPSYMAGYVVSRVSKVSEGFGHVSTSIDPNWNGALLIGLSNPTNKSIKVFVGGNDNREKNDSLATITLHYLNTSCEENNIEYRGMRLDLLNKIRYSDYSRKGIRNWFYKVFYIRRKKYTDFFFRYCDRKTISADNWNEVVRDFQGLPPYKECSKCKEYVENKKIKKCFSDYIIKENFFWELMNEIISHWESIKGLLLLIFLILVMFGILPNEYQDLIKRIFE